MPRPIAVRSKLPDERQAITHEFDIQGHRGYITFGLYEDGMPGEIFLVLAKEGSTISGFADAFAQMVSYALQYGVPQEVLIEKLSGMRFEPSGMTKNPEVRFAKSMIDYVVRFWAARFPRNRQAPTLEESNMPPCGKCGARMTLKEGNYTCEKCDLSTQPVAREDAPPCMRCGAVMVPSGTAWVCANCGNETGR